MSTDPISGDAEIPDDGGFVRTVLGDRTSIRPGVVYGHEHLIIDNPLIADRYPHIHLHDVDAAVREVTACRAAGAVLMLDAMPVAAGRDAVRLAQIADRAGVDIVATTGLHHDRYYGPLHWSNHLDPDTLADLFVADLVQGIDRFDYTGPVVRRTPHRAGVVKVATSGPQPDERDRRNIEAVARASVRTGAPVLTHCEDGVGGIAQVDLLTRYGVPAAAIVLSHVDKTHDLSYLTELAATGAVLELDQGLREYRHGRGSITVRAVLELIATGFGKQIILGTDGARRSLWTALGGTPGLAWLAEGLPPVLTEAGVGPSELADLLHGNAVNALTWRPPGPSTDRRSAA